jgi:hypothetical protein
MRKQREKEDPNIVLESNIFGEGRVLHLTGYKRDYFVFSPNQNIIIVMLMVKTCLEEENNFLKAFTKQFTAFIEQICFSLSY